MLLIIILRIYGNHINTTEYGVWMLCIHMLPAINILPMNCVYLTTKTCSGPHIMIRLDIKQKMLATYILHWYVSISIASNQLLLNELL